MVKRHLRLKLHMEMDYDRFVSEAMAHPFIEDLCTASGCVITDVSNYAFSRGCVIFKGDIEEEAARAILDAFTWIKENPGEEVPAALIPMRDFLSKYDVTFVEIVEAIKQTRKTPKPESDRNLLVLVHGLNGSSTSFGALPEYLRAATGCDVRHYDYPTKLLGHFPHLHFLGQNFDNWLRNNLVSQTNHFGVIAHSMGGVVVRKMLGGQMFRSQPIQKRMKCAVFVASPYSGVWLATLAKQLRLANEQVRDLAPDSPTLVEVNQQWQAWRQANQSLQGSIRSIYGLADQIVAPAIAAVDDPEAIPIFDADHFGIIKPKSPRDEIVITLARIANETGLAER